MIKKLIYILILSISFANIALATTQRAHISNRNMYDFSHCDIKIIIKNADLSMRKWENATKQADKDFYLEQAMRNYYLATCINYTKIDALTGLARVYTIMDKDKLAKEYYFKALSIDPYNPRANFYFADYYFGENDFIKSLFHYKMAYEHGYSKNFVLNYRLGVIYEKLADLESSKKFYQNALLINRNNSNLAEKIRLLDELNYDTSQYYLFSGKKRARGT